VERLEAHRAFFASLITASAGVPAGRLSEAFAATPRERFLGPGPWKIFIGTGYITTPTDDPAFLYQDVTVALSESGKINNGQPVLHAVGLAALNPQPGETAIHIGAGTGYYTAILARLVGPQGKVLAYEIEPAYGESCRHARRDRVSAIGRGRHAAGLQPDLRECRRNRAAGYLAGRAASRRASSVSAHARWAGRNSRRRRHAADYARSSGWLQRAVPDAGDVYQLPGRAR
jgi:hypothetical protein